MPPRIRQLPPLVVNQIAAGEVIERPASVVKELLENSLDAGASRIDIDVEQGGADLVRVVDDGHGIAPDDLPLAFASHATSKLQTADDLFRIGTLGFRGEALASIGGVAHVLLQSRPRDLLAGACIECRASELSVVRPWNGSAGTRIEVRHLFIDVPVRRKFLKTAATEMGHISESCTRLCLARFATETPGLHLVLRHNGRLVHEIPGTAKLLDRIERFFGPEVSGQVYPVEAVAGHAKLTGYIADPACDRGQARHQYLFVNGRWIRDRNLGHAVQEAYRGLLMTGRYAVCFLFLTLPADQVDVNVHPTKAEVRFRSAQAMHHLLYTSIKNRLRQANLVPRLQVPVGGAALPDLNQSPPIPAPKPTPVLPFVAPSTGDSRPPLASQPAPRAETPSIPLPPRPPIPETPRPWQEAPKVIQLYDAYLVVETEEGMLVIDQHALHERILFEQFTKRIATGTLQTQPLLIPEPIDLTTEQAARTLAERDALAELGLGVEEFGGSTILLTRYPVLLGKRSPRAALLAVVDRLANEERAPSREMLFNELLSLMACHSAVRAGERLTPEQMSELLAQRHLADDAHHCPHGRPTALLFSRQELERQFRRA